MKINNVFSRSYGTCPSGCDTCAAEICTNCKKGFYPIPFTPTTVSSTPTTTAESSTRSIRTQSTDNSESTYSSDSTEVSGEPSTAHRTSEAASTSTGGARSGKNAANNTTFVECKKCNATNCAACDGPHNCTECEKNCALTDGGECKCTGKNGLPLEVIIGISCAAGAVVLIIIIVIVVVCVLKRRRVPAEPPTAPPTRDELEDKYRETTGTAHVSMNNTLFHPYSY